MQFVSSVSRPKNPSSVSIWISSMFVRGRYTSRTFEGLSEEAALEGLSEGGAFVLEEASGGLLEEAVVAAGLSCSGRKRSCADSTLKSRKGMLTDVSRSYQRPWCNFQHVANAVCACWKVLTLCLSRLCWTPWQMYPASKPGAHKLYPSISPPLCCTHTARETSSPHRTQP
jgi:hypothetical protein